MNEHGLLTIEETAPGIFLHDMGKFMQRAHSPLDETDPAVRARAGQILPKFGRRPTRWHALWTDAFFEKLGHVRLPGARKEEVGDSAGHHHHPSPNIPLTVSAAKADRLATGMDGSPLVEGTDPEADALTRRECLRTPLVNPFAGLDLGIGLGELPHSRVP
ncbi:MAG: hypothetical protein ACP5U2_00470, partial [Bryobacteraceae bacterium]